MQVDDKWNYDHTSKAAQGAALRHFASKDASGRSMLQARRTGQQFGNANLTFSSL
jgi:hypothetical protein